MEVSPQQSCNLKTQIGIYAVAILMMGAIGVSSSIGVFMTSYQIDQVTALGVVSVPCFVIIFVTLVSGWLMSVMAKKTISIIGILLFIAGGTAPAFVDSWTAVIACRVIFGLGLGMVQASTAALVAENYEGTERDKVMGRMTSFQMLGCVLFSIIGGMLGSIVDMGYQAVFYVHLIGLVSLAGVVACVPYRRPERDSARRAGHDGGIKVTAGVVLWFVVAVVFFMGGQVYSNVINVLITEFGFGGPAEAGISLAIFAFGGFFAGLLFGKIYEIARGLTLSIGLGVLAISYALMAFASGLPEIYLGSLLCGLAFSICIPLIMSSISNAAVNPASASFAVSLATCGQSIGQSASPYVISPIGGLLSQVTGLTVNQSSLVVAVAICIVFAAAFVFVGFGRGRKPQTR
ncbi:MFS transporter [Adlercreutzia sp. R25]|uniref:MFS transporter n=1 Tax=Adlercreutzia shanghongiae TaxID=3111773 RepID=A0ABU6J1C6_9ACTN|nr:MULTISPECIES: MFS transporter [unclassified Adlercreutzia]MEC4273449.1 MFS transporter [Adlercreutzia sp. R25]MEC4295711.1 MFS transporter [Adlercreutzia sp. R22]